MEDKFITITKADGTFEKMEIVAAFRLEDSGKDCIIYRGLSDNKYFAASYSGDLEYASLDTNFTDQEKEQLNHIFKVLNCRGDMDA